jgi:hypothetical protein
MRFLMHFRFKTFIQNFLLALLISIVFILMIFTVRTIIDPMDNNPELSKVSDQIFSIFLWPYYSIENNFIGYDADISHRFDLIWTPLGVLLTLIYIALAGNIVYFLARLFKLKDEDK